MNPTPSRPRRTLRHWWAQEIAPYLSRRGKRRSFNSVGCPQLPLKPTAWEIAQFVRDSANWERIQPYGHEMNARQWAATCLDSVAGEIERS
jgi:hypothetical protein